ncbi:uncharacterized protein LOC132729879 isoform X2 [Ruditapes philippinarum]|uniref:uncharacterized protein LOC132729879 isoform X2 n=1 Tax=Ruditapes philippinarum TaxID=129788 RepID=UPI00295A8E79|nr:uncharacterized protein LOC132729879 isoform X2 [Ruditapes philippinarum]
MSFSGCLTSANEAAEASAMEMQRNADDTDGNSSRDDEDEKNRVFWPKCLLLMLAVMMLIAGIVAVIVVVDKDEPEPRGKVIPDPITHEECKSRSFYLGDKLNFTCIFDVTHEYRKILTKAKKVEVIPQNKVLANNLFTYSMKITNDVSSRYEITITNGSRAKCSSNGTYDVIFKDENDEAIHSANVRFAIKEATLKTTMTQKVLTGSRCMQTDSGDLVTEFEVTCNLHNGCNNYHTTIYRRTKSGSEESLIQYLKCERNFTDTDGHMMSCSASLPDIFVENFVYLGCKVETRLPNNKLLKLNAPFTLPECGIDSKCDNKQPNSERFDCSKTSKDFQNLLQAKCDAKKLKNCLKPGRTVFSLNKDRYENLTCSEDNVVPVCRLSWCANYRTIITKNEIPGEEICKENFNEPYVSPTTTVSTSTSTSSSSTSSTITSTTPATITSTTTSTKTSTTTSTKTSTTTSTISSITPSTITSTTSSSTTPSQTSSTLTSSSSSKTVTRPTTSK